MLILFLLVIESQAGLILQDSWTAARVMTPEFGFLGQTFTAEDPLIASIGIGVLVFGPDLTERGITMSLYAGAGNHGQLLGTATVDPPHAGPLDTEAWLDFAFPNVTFNPGSVYTFTYLAESRYWGGQINQFSYPNGTPLSGFDYTGGHLFEDPPSVYESIMDLRFRVVPVPEPSVGWIGGAAIGLIWLARLKRKRRASTAD